MQEHDDRARCEPHGQGDQQVLQARAVVGRQPRDLEGRCLQPAPVAQSDEDQVAAGRRDQPRQQHRDQRGAQPEPASINSTPAGRGPEQGRDRRERPGRRQHTALARPGARNGRRSSPPPSRGRSAVPPGRAPRRTRRPERRQRHAGAPRDWCGLHADPAQRVVAAVVGQHRGGQRPPGPLRPPAARSPGTRAGSSSRGRRAGRPRAVLELVDHHGKPAATRAAGTPIRAPIRIRRR